MYFLEQSDFDIAIRQDQLTKLLGDNPQQMLDKAENEAITRCISYFSGRYDATASFAATGDQRNALLVSTVIDIALYYMHSHINARNIPDLRRDRYEEALDLLKGVMKGTRTIPGLPLFEIAGQTTFHLFTRKPQFNTDGNVF